VSDTKNCDHDRLVRLEADFKNLDCEDHEERMRVLENKVVRNSMLGNIGTWIIQALLGALIVALIKGWIKLP